MGGNGGFNGKGAKTSMVEFARGSGRLDVTTEEPYELARHVRGTLGNATVVVTGLTILSSFQLQAQLVVDVGKSCCNIGSCGHGRAVRELRIKRRVEPIVCEEGGLLSRVALVVVERELSEREVVDPVVLLVGDVGTEVRLERLVGTLSQAIGLGMVGGGMLEVCAKKRGKFCPKLRNECGASVRDNGRREAVITKDAVEE